MNFLTITLGEYLRRISLLYIYKLYYLVNCTKANSNSVKKLTALVISCQTAVLQNNSQCLLLNILINATRDIFPFVRNENTKNEYT